MIHLLVRLFYCLFTGLILIAGSGCMQSAENPPYPTEEQMAALSSPEGMANYLRSLPSIRDIRIWENPYGPGLKIQTSHYEICTTLMEPLMLRRLPFFLESAYDAYCSQVPDPVVSNRLFRTYLFGERSQWEAFTREATGPQAETYLKIQRGAYALKDVCVAYNIGLERTFSVIGHEGWHQFTFRHFKFRIPSWLDEGIAMLFEEFRFEENRYVFEPQNNLIRLGALKLTLQNHRMLPLRDLIELNPGQVLHGADEVGNQEYVMAFYAQAYALVRFLREENYGRRLKNYHNLLLAGHRGNWPLSAEEKHIAADRTIPLTVAWNRQVSPKLFSLYIDSDIERLEQQYRDYCQKIVYHVRVLSQGDESR